MRKWLARLSFSFMIFAAVLAYEGYHIYHGQRGPRPAWMAYAFFAGAALCFGLALRGVRERHRMPDGDRRPDDDTGDGHNDRDGRDGR
jgi:hypothetical protein